MISGKLVETIFRRLWVLAIPVLLVPVLAVALTGGSATYQSRATVWVTDPLGDATASVGQSSAYLSPAQNQVQALNDLLATNAFRRTVALSAGIVSPGDSAQAIETTATRMSITASTGGVNLLSVTARACTASPVQTAWSAS